MTMQLQILSSRDELDLDIADDLELELEPDPPGRPRSMSVTTSFFFRCTEMKFNNLPSASRALGHLEVIYLQQCFQNVWHVEVCLSAKSDKVHIHVL